MDCKCHIQVSIVLILISSPTLAASLDEIPVATHKSDTISGDSCYLKSK